MIQTIKNQNKGDITITECTQKVFEFQGLNCRKVEGRFNGGTIAYILMHEFRRLGLKGTEFAKAQCHIIRNKLLKIGAQVTISVCRIFVSFASGYPHQHVFQYIYWRLRKGHVCPTR